MPASELPSAEELDANYGSLTSQDLVTALTRDAFRGRIALITSFGAESALLLDLVARAEPATPVIFLETGKHFAETLYYRDLAIGRFGLTDVRQIRPDPQMLAAIDPGGDLWQSNPDACCRLRKVVPLREVLQPFEVILTGRKRVHGGERAEVPLFEAFDGRIRVNPLACWSQAEIAERMETAGLPRHPLAERGYTSIGCRHCTRQPEEGAGLRSGRWVDSTKSECGIHLPSSLGRGC